MTRLICCTHARSRGVKVNDMHGGADMAEKKTLMVCETKDFIAAMNPKREAKKKTDSNNRSVKRHHALGR